MSQTEPQQLEQVEQDAQETKPNSKFKQRMIGALVLIALVVIFIPMLFKKQQEPELPQVEVQSRSMPEPTAIQEYPVKEVAVVAPKPVQQEQKQEVLADKEHKLPPNLLDVAASHLSDKPANTKPLITEPEKVQEKPEKPEKPDKPTAVKKDEQLGIDSNNLPLSWSIQLASVQSLEGANKLRDKYRDKGYKAYVRSDNKLYKVQIGPMLRRNDAAQICSKIKQKDQQDCFVVRFEPEKAYQ